MRRNGNGTTSLAKGLFAGSVLGATVALLYARRSRTGFRSEIPQEDARFRRRYQPLATTSVERIVDTRKLARRTIGWLVVFCFASAVAMISDLKLKKI